MINSLRDITREQKSEVLLLYSEGNGISYISKSLGINRIIIQQLSSSIRRGRADRTVQRMSLDVNYFKNIDSEHKAYWLGYICADGSINKDSNKLSLVSRDLEIISYFKKDIGSGHKISMFDTFDKRTNKSYRINSIQICSKLFCDNLIRIGITNKKTDHLKMPDIDEVYWSHFYRGMMDGDGSIGFRPLNKNLIRASLISTKDILFHLQEYLQYKFDIPKTNLYKVSENRANVWKLHIYEGVEKYLDWIYNGATIFLKRKHDIYIEYKNTDRIVPSNAKKNIDINKVHSLLQSGMTQFEVAKILGTNQSCISSHYRKSKLYTPRNKYDLIKLNNGKTNNIH